MGVVVLDDKLRDFMEEIDIEVSIFLSLLEVDLEASESDQAVSHSNHDSTVLLDDISVVFWVSRNGVSRNYLFRSQPKFFNHFLICLKTKNLSLLGAYKAQSSGRSHSEVEHVLTGEILSDGASEDGSAVSHSRIRGLSSSLVLKLPKFTLYKKFRIENKILHEPKNRNITPSPVRSKRSQNLLSQIDQIFCINLFFCSYSDS